MAAQNISARPARRWVRVSPAAPRSSYSTASRPRWSHADVGHVDGQRLVPGDREAGVGVFRRPELLRRVVGGAEPFRGDAQQAGVELAVAVLIVEQFDRV